MGASIERIEYVFPKKKITNKDLQNEFPDYNFFKFEKKVGIESRYIVAEDETALDLAIKACEKLFAGNIDKSEIDFILFCTQSPEYFLPTSACILQDKLLLRKNIGALDFNLGCSGFTYGLSLAKGLIASNQAKKILLVTAETYSKFIHKKDRTNRSIFGDAAAATLISYSEQDNIGDFIYTVITKDGKQVANKVRVERGLTYKGETEILQGLNSGDEIISAGYREAVTGIPIQLAK